MSFRRKHSNLMAGQGGAVGRSARTAALLLALQAIGGGAWCFDVQAQVGGDPLERARNQSSEGLTQAEAARLRVQQNLQRQNDPRQLNPGIDQNLERSASDGDAIGAPEASRVVSRPVRRDPVLSSDAESPKGGGGIWTTLTALGFVIGLILIARWAAVKFLGGRMGALSVGSSSVVQVLSRTPLAPKSHLLLVRVGERVLVLSDHATGVRALSEITDPDEVLDLVTQSRRGTSSSQSLGVDGMGTEFDQGLQKALADGAFESDFMDHDGFADRASSTSWSRWLPKALTAAWSSVESRRVDAPDMEEPQELGSAIDGVADRLDRLTERSGRSGLTSAGDSKSTSRPETRLASREIIA